MLVMFPVCTFNIYILYNYIHEVFGKNNTCHGGTAVDKAAATMIM